MRLFFILLLVAATAIAGAWFLVDEPGLVTIEWGEWLIETSMAFAIIVLVATVTIVWMLVRLLAAIVSLPLRIAAWRRRRRAEAARRAVSQALVEMAEGRWSKAEKLFVRAAQDERVPLVCYFGAARAAQAQAAYERRDDYLRRAAESDPKAGLAAGFAQAGFQIDAGQHELALATLSRLGEIAPDHAHLLRLQTLLARRMNDADAILGLATKLRRHKVYPMEEIDTLERDAALARMTRCATQCDARGLDDLWNALPRHLTAQPVLTAACARGWLRLGEQQRAAEILRAALKRGYAAEAVAAFGLVRHEDPAAALAFAERFLEEHSRDAILLLALGRLARGAKLWGKARSYIEASIGIDPTAEAYRELAELLDRMGGPEQAGDCYRKGLRLAIEGIAEPTADLRTPRPATAPRAFSSVDDESLGV